MCKKHQIVFNDNIRYFMNDVTKYFKVIILKYNEHVHELFGVSCYIYPPIKMDEDFYNSNWTDNEKHFSYEVICKAIKDCLPNEMQE